MRKEIKRLVTKTYEEVFKERSLKVFRDIILLLVLFLISYKIEIATAGKAIVLFEQSYRLDILLFYLVGFVFIISSSILFVDVKNFLNIISRFVITRFPRMKGDFGPTKRIFRNLVHVMLMILVFYSVSPFFKDKSFVILSLNIELLYIVSLFFLILTLLFVYDIIFQLLRVIGKHSKKLEKLLKLDKVKDTRFK